MPAFALRDAQGQLTLIHDEVVIGRDKACLIRPASDPLVERIHATLWTEDHSVRLRAEHTHSGTFVNEERLHPGLARELEPGDKVRVGAGVWEVVVLPNAVPRPPAPAGSRRPLPDWVVAAGAVAAVLAALAAVLVSMWNR